MTAAITPKAGVIGGRNAREARGTRGNGPSATSDFATHRREIGTFVVTIPFFAYTACFLLAYPETLCFRTWTPAGPGASAHFLRGRAGYPFRGNSGTWRFD